MDKLVELVNKHKGTAFMILFCIITVPIILCQIIYKIETPYEWLNGEFGAGELLGYIGNSLTFVGTIILGFLAVKQNIELAELSKHQNSTNDKMMELTINANDISERMLNIERDRSLPLVSFDIHDSGIDDHFSSVRLSFRNETPIDILEYKIEFEDKNIINQQIEKNNINLKEWEVPSCHMGASSDLLWKQCNANWNLEFTEGGYILYVNVKVYAANGEYREQHFQILIIKRAIFLCNHILI